VKTKIKAKAKKQNGHPLPTNGGKKPTDEMVTFTPNRQASLNVNGRTIEVGQGIKTTVPAAYFHLFQQSR
jgi:hypothetical protein